MTDWSSCDSACTQVSLSYSGDQISYWASRMSAHNAGAWQGGWFLNDAWGSDATEDTRGGEDNNYADHNTMWAYSGHGAGPSNSAGETFVAPFCHAGTVSSCQYDAKNSDWGEHGGADATPYVGKARYLLWLTCYSVDVDPIHQWSPSMHRGLDVVMGYRGTSADSSTTDEVGGDLADRTFGDMVQWKPAWFWAMEDWWVDDVGSIFVSGSSSTDASSRRDNIMWNWGERTDGAYYNWFAWSWHNG